ncbi:MULTISPECIES: hypothetical protein [Halorussus]|uniref:hypothetical protein n=1 Tax=Halorussus TaxID=1070314 RepID=UPI00209C9CAD|nr:hypothetical protein [Halorussus vallis]USZ76913.1 hypothetical protein NGM07_06180 [Halorussus vallis]
MRIREWQDIVDDVTDERVDPEGWRAVGGTRSGGVGEDLYLGHPRGGLYLLKTYAKNPYDVRGVGARVARKLDDEIGTFLPEKDREARFAVQRPPEGEEDAERKARHLSEVVKAHADAPTTPNDFFDDLMEALDSPAFGPIDYDFADRPDNVEDLSERFEEAEDLLNAELDDLIDEDEVGRGFQ